MPLKQLMPGQIAYASDVNQLVLALNGGDSRLGGDLGTLTLLGPQTAPAAPTATVLSTAGNLNGSTSYVVVLGTGWLSDDGNFHLTGFAPGMASATVSPANQQVQLSNVAIGGLGTVLRLIYRTPVGSTTYKYVGWIPDNSTTTFTDNVPDSQLGTGMPTVIGAAIPSTLPTSNTTGSSLTLPQLTATNGMTVGGHINLFQPAGNTGTEAADLVFYGSSSLTVSTSAPSFVLSLRNQSSTADQDAALLLYTGDGTSYYRWFEFMYNGGKPYTIVGQQLVNVPNVRWSNTSSQWGGGIFTNSLMGHFLSVPPNGAGGAAVTLPYTLPSNSPTGTPGAWAVASMQFTGSGTMYFTGVNLVNGTTVDVYQSSSGNLNCYVIVGWGPD